MADIRVLMMGGRRSGKSSILASMVEQMSNDVVLCKQFINMTPCRDNDNTALSLEQKRNKLVSFLESKPVKCHYLVDFGADFQFNFYDFKCKIPKPNGGTHWGNIKVEFIDCPGEAFDINSQPTQYNELEKYVSNSDIFIIVVDTPYLMAEKSDSGKFSDVNKTSTIKELLKTNVHFKREDDYKKIIFVPVKCEKWKNNLDAVSQKLKEQNYFGSIMDLIDSDARWSYSIIPAITAGSIEFSEFGKPSLERNTMMECSQLGNSPIYRMKDGNNKMIKKEDVIANTDVHFPFYSWFINNDNKYAPENCDQIGLHIWRFIIYKTKIDTSNTFLPNLLRGFPTISKLGEMIKTMETCGKIRDDGNGIVNLRKIEHL